MNEACWIKAVSLYFNYSMCAAMHPVLGENVHSAGRKINMYALYSPTFIDVGGECWPSEVKVLELHNKLLWATVRFTRLVWMENLCCCCDNEPAVQGTWQQQAIRSRLRSNYMHGWRVILHLHAVMSRKSEKRKAGEEDLGFMVCRGGRGEVALHEIELEWWHCS